MEDDREGWQGFLDLCSKMDSVEQMKSSFELFFTIEERAQIASRYCIIAALLEGKLTQREIAKKYRVSIAQITRGSNALKIIDPKLKRFLARAYGLE